MRKSQRCIPLLASTVSTAGCRLSDGGERDPQCLVIYIRNMSFLALPRLVSGAGLRSRQVCVSCAPPAETSACAACPPASTFTACCRHGGGPSRAASRSGPREPGRVQRINHNRLEYCPHSVRQVGGVRGAARLRELPATGRFRKQSRDVAGRTYPSRRLGGRRCRTRGPEERQRQRRRARSCRRLRRRPKASTSEGRRRS